MPDIKVIDLSNVMIDGVNVGSVTDAMANHGADAKGNPVEGFHSAMLAELTAHIGGIRAGHEAAMKAQADAHQAELAALATAHAGQVAAKDKEATDQAARAASRAAKREAEHSRQVVQARADTTSARADLDRHRAMLEDLGGEAAWQKSHPARRAALLEMQRQVAAKLVEHDAAPPAPQAGA